MRIFLRGDHVRVLREIDARGAWKKVRPAIVLSTVQHYPENRTVSRRIRVYYLDKEGGVAEIHDSHCEKMTPLEALAWGTKD